MKASKTQNNNFNRENFSFYYIKNTETHDLIPIECGIEHCLADKLRISTKYNYYSMHCILNGKGYYRIRNKLIPLSKNTIFSFFPGEHIEYYPDPQDPWEYVWINFVGVKAKYFMDTCGFSCENPSYSYKSPHITKIFKKTIAHENILTRDFLTVARLYEIFAYIIDERKTIWTSPPQFNENYMSATLSYIAEHYIDPELSIKHITNLLGFNENYFSRLFKKEIGVPFTKYVNHFRILKACEYIEKTEATYKEIANMVGFSDPLYFSKRFKELINITPSEYRKAARNKKTSIQQNKTDP